jgi:hypothetical protein
MMKVEKLPIVSNRLRRISDGFGWVDHRLVQDGHLRGCSSDGLALYLVLVTVADQDGLSYYGDSLLSALLGWSRKRLETARENLLAADLIAWGAPLYQALELPEANGGGK